MTALNETAHPGDFILSEADGYRSRDNVTIVSGQNLGAGAVVGKITATGKYAAYDNQASDGTQTAAGVLYAAVDASDGDMPGVILDTDCELVADAVDFGSGSSGADETAGTADLLALGIKLR